MKPQPSLCVLTAVAAAGALLIGCEGSIEQLPPGASDESQLIAAYVDPLTPTPGVNPRLGGDGDLLPIIDGDPQDKEWNIAKPLYVYLDGDQAVGGRGFYAEVRAIWSDEGRYANADDHLYLMVRYADETMDFLPDYWRYATPGALGLVPSPEWNAPRNDCDDNIVRGANWYVENANGVEDQVSLVFEIDPDGTNPASDELGTFAELGCQVACHSGTDPVVGSKGFGAVGSGKLDLWVWRAGRTNAVETTAYPDLSQVDRDTGIPTSQYPQIDSDNTWPAWMEDMVLTPAGMAHDRNDPNYLFTKPGYTGQLYTLNVTSNPEVTVDGLPVPHYITEKVIERREGTGGTAQMEEEGPPNGGLPPKFYLWGPTADAFGICDSSATSRQASANYPNWSQNLPVGDTDVMPGYRLWVPSGSAADVRAKGEFRNVATKRFSNWGLEIRRVLDTGNDDDVAFDPDKEYNFALAVFDRSSQVHSGSGPLKLRFQPSRYATKSAMPEGR